MTAKLTRFLQKFSWLLLLQCLLVPAALAELQKVDKLKAAYMYNFTKFITWPKENAVPISFCIHNDQELMTFLKALVESREPNSKSLLVLDSVDTQSCDILYLTESDDLLEQHLSHSVIISDVNNVLALPVVFRFYEENQKLRFEIDVAEAERLNVKISAKLLRVARIK